jgi:YVTN family beta-propeller protein
MGITQDTIWITNVDDGTITLIDLQTNQVVATIALQRWPIQTNPVDIAIGEDAIWIANRGGSVARLTPEPTNGGE